MQALLSVAWGISPWTASLQLQNRALRSHKMRWKILCALSLALNLVSDRPLTLDHRSCQLLHTDTSLQLARHHLPDNQMLESIDWWSAMLAIFAAGQLVCSWKTHESRVRKQVGGAVGAQPRIGGPISYIKPNGRQLQATVKGSAKSAAKATAAAQPELQGSWWVPDTSQQKPAAAEGSVAKEKRAVTESGKVRMAHSNCT